MRTPGTVALLARLPQVGSDVPVDPDASTAQKWAADELTRAEYHHGRSLLARLVDWIQAQFDGLPSVGLPPWQAAVVVVAVLVVIALAALWVTGPVRVNRTRRAAAEVLSRDDTRTAAQLRAAADAAAAIGDHRLAVLERFRALVRSLEERTVLEVRPGRTAHEVADEAGRRLPAVADDLVRAGHLFDDVAYGSASADAEDDRWVRELDERTRSLRPGLPADLVAAASAPADSTDGDR
ncbi:DUF4129 domain-containing protein [Cellulomonas soli]|uniref:Protein-glutamine gamma-glutamyltransferase-like C-terminal domain-containing protein n=1 Tax=Cellulomonas soli TaxID=931535 RepID=A0A512P7W7_9CELL|nr:DUF4129 domain-containing protein [Cellulomonas soli]NYI57517.1 hypothetical protein [Cellulomonas soli]GEP67294.1 hypothetical protein CSO01_00090 [Cellulomonas soli]